VEALNDKSSIVSPAVRRGPRRLLRFEDIEVSQPAPESFSCRVTLAGQRDRVFIGEGKSVVLGAATTAAARATLRAIQAYANARLTLESIRKTNVGGRDLILVVVSVSAHPPQELAGAVVVRGDDSKAAALAVLDATNRWLDLHNTEGFSPASSQVT
jgi:hypothetical protein